MYSLFASGFLDNSTSIFISLVTNILRTYELHNFYSEDMNLLSSFAATAERLPRILCGMHKFFVYFLASGSQYSYERL